MKDKITLSVNPSYKCNLRCEFCYLSVEQLASTKLLDLDLFYERLSEISTHRFIEHIDLYGGEIALIKEEYLTQMERTIRVFYKGPINVITNLTIINSFFLKEGIELSVSWDYFARDQFEKVYQNMHSLDKNFHILILASDKLIQMNDAELDEFIHLLNSLPKLTTVEIKPYSFNKFNTQEVTYLQHEEWIKRWIMRSGFFRFEFINLTRIKASLSRNYSSWSDEHLYITPSGNYAVLEFDEENREYFSELPNYEQYLNWIQKEKCVVESNSFCGGCTYLGSCLSEHLQPVYNIEYSCNGFKNLLDWYKTQELNSR